ncbi:MAG: hypothetical protein ABGZ36_03855 [Actinomycetota bacterium]
MTPAIEDDAALRRHVRTIITMADNVRRGALPARALQRIVTPQVAADIATEFPSMPGVSIVTGVHLQHQSEVRSHFTGLALRPDGSAVAYLGLAARESPTDPWQVTQVLPVSEKTLGREADGRAVASPPDQVAAIRSVIAGGYLDATVQLLGPIPRRNGQRRDWAEAGEAIVRYAQDVDLSPSALAQALETDRQPTSDLEREARTYVDSYRSTYGIAQDRYETFEARVDALRGRNNDQAAEAGLEIER